MKVKMCGLKKSQWTEALANNDMAPTWLLCMFYGLYKASHVAISFYSFICHSFKINVHMFQLARERLVIILYTRHLQGLLGNCFLVCDV